MFTLRSSSSSITTNTYSYSFLLKWRCACNLAHIVNANIILCGSHDSMTMKIRIFEIKFKSLLEHTCILNKYMFFYMINDWRAVGAAEKQAIREFTTAWSTKTLKHIYFDDINLKQIKFQHSCEIFWEEKKHANLT